MILPNRNVILLIIIILLIIVTCTQNPAFQDKTVQDYNQIRGLVKLSDGLPPGNVFVWFKELDIQTRTDEDGEFSVNIPSPGQQPGGGISGVYSVYFFLANYRIDSVQVILNNGILEYNILDIGGLGELKQPVLLNPFLHIQVSIIPDSFSLSLKDTLLLNLKFEYIRDMGPVDVWYYSKDERLSYFIKGKGSLSSTSIWVNHILGGDRHKNLLDSLRNKFEVSFPIFWPTSSDSLVFIMPDAELIPGDYKFIPYIVIWNSYIPYNFNASLVNVVKKDGPEFVHYPIKIDGGDVRITE